MAKFANVKFAYTPKNTDELELQVGDKIEVICVEEEGWWRGRLKNKVGVFPTNFVEFIDIPIATHPNKPLAITQTPPISSKINLFTNKLSKSSLSLNNTFNNSSNSANNPNRSNGLMDNAQDQDALASQQATKEDASITDRRLKPVRNMTFGEMFAGGKPKLTPIDQSASPSIDRVSTPISGQLQKPIPKKPPPPAPTTDTSSLQHQQQEHVPPPPPKPLAVKAHGIMREQARVMYQYIAQNVDELNLKEGDIINVLNKDIEDKGWWKGELNGKIGVFPDNFVELVNTTKPTNLEFPKKQPPLPFPKLSTPIHSDEKPKNSPLSNATKVFSKELESCLERSSNSPASFLSLKRNKLAQISQSSLNRSDEQQVSLDEDIIVTNGNKLVSSSASVSATNSFIQESNGENDHVKLNHLTTGRAKGPARRPPSNLTNKKSPNDTTTSSQSDQDQSKEQLQSYQQTQLINAQQQPPPLPPQIQAHTQTTQQKPLQSECSKYIYKSDEVEEFKAELINLKKQVGDLMSLRNEVNDIKGLLKEIVGVLADEGKKMAAIQLHLEKDSKY